MTASSMTPGVLVEVLGLSAGPAVWGYRDAVVSAARELGLAVEVTHDLGPVQIGLILPAAPELSVGWRADYGWYLVRRHRPGEAPAVGPTRCRPAAGPLDRLMPEPAAVARWLGELDAGRWAGTDPEPVIASAACVRAALNRLRGYLPPVGAPLCHALYSWSDDRPLNSPALSVSRNASPAV